MDTKILQEFNVFGIVAGVLSWVGLVWWLAEESECSRYNSCDSGDMVQISIISLGLLVPAGIIALIASILTKR